MPPPTCLAALVLALLPGGLPAPAAPAGWPTLHADNQRSGYAPATIAGPCQRKWYRSLVTELIGPRVEPIVAEGRVFVGTYAGNLYAFDAADGSTAWRYRAAGAIGHSPCYCNGKVFFATDEGCDCGRIQCLAALSGRPLWSYRADAGFWTAPACDGRTVYAGDRAGVFHAVDAQSGRRRWTFSAGYMILKPASISADGRQIVFGAEDMHVYCLSPEGKLLWKSRKLAGLSLRDAAPTIWGRRVIVRTNPARDFHQSIQEGRLLLNEIQRSLPMLAEDHVILHTQNSLFLRRTQRRQRAENAGVRRFLQEHPCSRTWFTLDMADGREPWIVPVLFTSGMHNPPSPPTYNPRTLELYTIIPTAIGVYCSGVSQTGIGIGRVDPRTGDVTNVAHAAGDVEPGYFAGMPMITDETSSLGLAGDFLLVTHMGALGGVDLGTRKIRPLCGARDSYGGLFGPGVHGGWDASQRLAEQGFVENTVNEWHGPDRAAAAVCGPRIFWLAGSCLICVGTSAVPAAASGGPRPPEPFRWPNVPRIDGGNVTGPWAATTARCRQSNSRPARSKSTSPRPPPAGQRRPPPRPAPTPHRTPLAAGSTRP